MSSTIDKIMSLSRDIMASPKHVKMNEAGIERLAGELASNRPARPSKRPVNADAVRDVVLHEVIASSVNYRYWRGGHDIRPEGASSPRMYRLLDEALECCSESGNLEYAIKRFLELLILNRYPGVQDRARHLAELDLGKLNSISNMIYRAIAGESSINIEHCLDTLICYFPGFAEDAFLKRAFLVFHQIHRETGWLEEAIRPFPIPADYQIPKVLRSKGCFVYGAALTAAVDGGELIPKESRMELEIRAGAILACERIAELAKMTMCDVDFALFEMRKSCPGPFHLTITSDY